MKLRRIVALGAAVAVLTGGLLGVATAAHASTGAVVAAPAVSGANADYARVVQLQHSADTSKRGTLLTLYSVNKDGTRSHFEIRRSTDGGANWSTASTIYSPTSTFGIYTGTLFEVPKASGGLPAGTLLAAGTAWDQKNTDFTNFKLQTFVSTDYGASWTPRGDCWDKTSGSATSEGLWEPEFTQLGDGSLACYFSDETQQSAPNQVLAMTTSTDGGSTWTGEHQVVALPNAGARPGMAIVQPLPNGSYALAFEYCIANGQTSDQTCRVYYKTSTDGTTWTANSLGTLVQTSDGKQLLHTPALTWTSAGGPNGTLLMAGQRVVTGSDGATTAVAPESGRVLFANTNLGAGAWSEVSAPITVDPTGGYAPGEGACANYSPSLIPTMSGQAVQMVTPVFVPGQAQNCEVHFGISSVGQLPFYAPLDSLNDMGWSTYGGTWGVGTGGIYRQSDATAKGAKSLSGSTAWTNYTANTDVRLNSSGQAGLLVRASQPGTGVDAVRGYYVGVDQASGQLLIGRETGSWTQLQSTSVTGGVSTGSWGNLSVTASGCTISARYQNATTGTVTTLAATDNATDCISAGQIGLRTQLADASFRTVTAQPANSATPATSSSWNASGLSGWNQYGGSWNANGGTVTQSAAGADGPKLLNTATAGASVVEANVALGTLTTANGNAGVVSRVTSPGTGVDTFQGYYAGIDGTNNSLVLGKEAGGWSPLGTNALPGVSSSGLSGVGVHISLAAQGCTLTAAAQLTTSWDKALVQTNDPNCLTSGVSGVRAFNTTASWNNFTVNPG